MAGNEIFQAFKIANCRELNIYVDLSLGKSQLSRIKSCLGGKRVNLPYFFAGAYPGEGENKIGATASIRRAGRSRFSIHVSWFQVNNDPPPGSVHPKEMINILCTHFGDKEVFVNAVFAYSTKKADSLFKPIALVGQTTIFDAITGFTGIKKKPDGKLLYQLEVLFGNEEVSHTVNFNQTVKLSEDAPLTLIDTASKISSLALKMKGE